MLPNGLELSCVATFYRGLENTFRDFVYSSAVVCCVLVFQLMIKTQAAVATSA